VPEPDKRRVHVHPLHDRQQLDKELSRLDLSLSQLPSPPCRNQIRDEYMFTPCTTDKTEFVLPPIPVSNDLMTTFAF
jgi:hypothetical protein